MIKISGLISYLEKIKSENGDLGIVSEYTGPVLNTEDLFGLSFTELELIPQEERDKTVYDLRRVLRTEPVLVILEF